MQRHSAHRHYQLLWLSAPSPTPTAAPQPTPCLPTFDGGGSTSCECSPDDPYCVSPVVVDVAGNGFKLTNAADGVDFDITANGSTLRIAWTIVESDDAWLALDRNGNSMIDNGRELFGNFTPQPDPPAGHERNGFLALAEYDKSEMGGNHDGMIDHRDSAFQRCGCGRTQTTTACLRLANFILCLRRA